MKASKTTSSCFTSLITLLAIIQSLCNAFHTLPLKESKSFLQMTYTSSTKSQVKKVKILGICGGIGSGKSLICNILSTNPDLFPNVLKCIDSDKLAHSVYDVGSQASKDIIKAFGSAILHGIEDNAENNITKKEALIIDRKKLGEIVFQSKEEMSKLEQIVWPHVKTKLIDICQDISKTAQKLEAEEEDSVIVIEAAMMLDANWDDLFDAMWIVHCNSCTQEERLMNFRGLISQEAKKRIDAQKSRKGMTSDAAQQEFINGKGVVTAVIKNEGSLEELKETLREIWNNPNSWKK